MKKKFILIAVLVLATLLSIMGVVWTKKSKNNNSPEFSFRIDNKLKPGLASLPGIKHGPAREVAVVMGPGGKKSEFVVNEVIFRSSDQNKVDAFIAKYDGTILSDGQPLEIEGAPGREIKEAEKRGSYLVRVSLGKIAVADFEKNAGLRKIKGTFTFSSENAVKLFALILNEANAGNVGANFLTRSNDIPEHPVNTRHTSFIDAGAWWWMDDCNVIPAWNYLKYQGVPPLTGSWRPATIAIIDGGFDLDEATGVPNLGNIDYQYSGTKPWQADFIDFDGTAGGPNPGLCSSGNECPWHGQSAFGVACAYPRNRFGGAGTGGDVVRPMLLKTDATFYSDAQAIRSAVVNGADVISMSFSGDCGGFTGICEEEMIDNWGGLYHIGIEDMKSAIQLAFGWDVACIAAAGNDTINTTGLRIFPLVLQGVIGVGSVDRDKKNVYNFGEEVDIWAPTHIRSTIDRESINRRDDNNDYGEDELANFGGTSASTPFIAGIVGLMKCLNPQLHPEDVKSVLQSTANHGNDPLVTWGYVDALKAVIKVKPNRPPAILVRTPASGSNVPYVSGDFFATITDPEPGAGLPLFYDKYKVVVTSDRDGIIGTFTHKSIKNGREGLGGTLGRLSAGMHRITATVIDPFGASGSQTFTVNSVNRPPTIRVISPVAGATARSHEEIALEAYAADPEEGSLPAHWISSIDGDLGTFYQTKRTLSVGQHKLKATVTDAMGLTSQALVTITIIPREGRPEAKIISPLTGTFTPEQIITFQGKGTDVEDGLLAGTSLKWSSDRDGFLGTGNTIRVQLSGPASPCNPEFVVHKITLTVTDRDGNTSSFSVMVQVGRLC